MKTQTIYVCQNCGAKATKLLGRCPQCGEWGSYQEEIIGNSVASSSKIHRIGEGGKPVLINQVVVEREMRIDMQNKEFNRVLGGGLVTGSLVLIGGEPGIGKSTLALQVLMQMKEKKTLYASGEESINQLKLRAQRLKGEPQNLYIVSETSLEKILEHVKLIQPEIVVIDSIQTIGVETLDSVIGSISQVRECTTRILQVAKETNIPFIIVGHITKEGSIAGPKVLEHLVDTVLQFEGDEHYMYRILRAQKNRFGSTSEIGIFEMQNDGLREVDNPSELLFNKNNSDLSGIAVAATIEGIRPFLIEVQALVSTAAYGTPQRSSTGFDPRRLNMLLAVLEKRVGFRLAQKDVFLNIAGGIKVSDPAIDLAVLAAILSSNMDLPIQNNVCLTGEVGLAGEIRPVNRIEQRIAEAAKLGMKKIVVPATQKIVNINHNIEILPVKKVSEAFKELIIKK